MSERLELVTVRTAHSVVDIEPTPLDEHGQVDTKNPSAYIDDTYGPDEALLDGHFTKADLARILLLMVEAEGAPKRTAG